MLSKSLLFKTQKRGGYWELRSVDLNERFFICKNLLKFNAWWETTNWKKEGGAENNDIPEVNLPKMTHNQIYVSVIRINPLQNTFATVR